MFSGSQGLSQGFCFQTTERAVLRDTGNDAEKRRMTVKYSVQKKFVSVDAASFLIVNQLACAQILVESVYCGCNTKIIAFKS